MKKKLNWFGEGKGDSLEKNYTQFEIIAIILKSCFFSGFKQRIDSCNDLIFESDVLNTTNSYKILPIKLLILHRVGSDYFQAPIDVVQCVFGISTVSPIYLSKRSVVSLEIPGRTQ